MLQCEFCDQSFSTGRTLSRHQRTAQFCLALQGKKDEIERSLKINKCPHCSESFSIASSLKRHMKNCGSVVNTTNGAQTPVPSEIQEEKQPVTESESMVKERLVKSLVQTEVRLESGIVDVVTRDEIIEIKKASLWKHALGQILAYAFEPECRNKNKRIHLFGSVKDKTKTKIVACCAHYGVSVSFDGADLSTSQHQLEQDGTLAIQPGETNQHPHASDQE